VSSGFLGARRQNKMPTAIRAIDSAVLGHRQEHAGVASILRTAIAIKLFGIDRYGLGCLFRGHSELGCQMKPQAIENGVSPQAPTYIYV